MQASVGVLAPAPRTVSAIRVKSDSFIAIVRHAQVLAVIRCEAKPQRFDWLAMSLHYHEKVTLFADLDDCVSVISLSKSPGGANGERR